MSEPRRGFFDAERHLDGWPGHARQRLERLLAEAPGPLHVADAGDVVTVADANGSSVLLAREEAGAVLRVVRRVDGARGWSFASLGVGTVALLAAAIMASRGGAGLASALVLLPLALISLGLFWQGRRIHRRAEREADELADELARGLGVRVRVAEEAQEEEEAEELEAHRRGDAVAEEDSSG
ncbi:MAG TPA: hypothetical protein RMH85_12580 [Polyangiaceae bacterium LLY-WYZ-15_(1-7)]|nr:hypothetical protein [Myxococcales bacterium]MAT24202.1 hypothetical protein [Sandaracinus sp.]HJL04038.1 hypothetical protein [Polyangiaceae bacterium LLY-WYZ-15_(1-7)]MBJ73073.1 hypothetical protein [Sandaracinus sp.]HJL09333.1 hypothetical protein [Polyangiaceae bacterium LLY-WYZ-15_(1-7)]